MVDFGENLNNDTKISNNFLFALFKLNQNEIDVLAKRLNQHGLNDEYSIRTNQNNQIESSLNNYDSNDNNKNSLLVRVLNIIEQKQKCSNFKQINRISSNSLDATKSRNMMPYGELFLILVVLSLWLLSILLCLTKYQKLRTIPPMLTPYSNEPMHIEDVKIVKNEQDTIIYRKKPSTFHKFSTVKNSTVDSTIQNYNNIKTNVGFKKKSKIRSASEPRLSLCIQSDINSKPYWSYSREYNNRLIKLHPIHTNSLSNNPTQTEIVRKKFLNTYSSNRLIYSKNTNKRVSDKRILYAKSKKKPLSEIKKNENTFSFRSCDQSDENTTCTSLKIGESSFETFDHNLANIKEVQETSFILKPKSIKLTRANQTFSGNSPMTMKSPGLLDPNWIPLKVQESLLNLHYVLHKKPTLLQTSHISKSDSNLKTRSVLDDFSKKLFSLQNSQEKKNSCLL